MSLKSERDLTPTKRVLTNHWFIKVYTNMYISTRMCTECESESERESEGYGDVREEWRKVKRSREGKEGGWEIETDLSPLTAKAFWIHTTFLSISNGSL